MPSAAAPRARVTVLSASSPVATRPAGTMSSLTVIVKQAAVTLTAAAITPAGVTLDLVGHGAGQSSRLAAQLSALLREASLTAQAMQKVLLAVADAIEDGLLEEVRGGLANLAVAVDLMAVVNQQLDQAMPVLDATTPSLKVMNSTLAQLNTTIAQLDALPGVRMARRFVGRPGAPEPV